MSRSDTRANAPHDLESDGTTIYEAIREAAASDFSEDQYGASIGAVIATAADELDGEVSIAELGGAIEDLQRRGDLRREDNRLFLEVGR